MPATLSLTLGTPATFGAFTPGVANDYFASTTGNVISTAGDATLSSSDARPPGQRRVQPAAAAAGGRSRRRTVDGARLQRPVDARVQAGIGANDALRTGTYSKTLTFTLSTTTP